MAAPTYLAGNTATGETSAGFQIDQTAPVITDDGPTTSANSNGWYNTDVTNEFCLDADISGPNAACACRPADAQSKTTIGEGFAVNVTSDPCTDLAGNTASGETSDDFKIDETAPVISDDGPTTNANSNGWYNTDVTNEFSLDAGISGPNAACAAAFPGNAQSKTTTGEGFAVTVTSDPCTDLAGNTANGETSAGFQIDQTAPVISGVAAPAANANGWNKTPVSVTFTCADVGSVQSTIDVNTVAGDDQNLTAQTTGTTVTSDGSASTRPATPTPSRASARSRSI